MLDPRVIEWYQYCSQENMSSQLEYSIVIIRQSDWDRLPDEYQKLYLSSNVHPLFFESFDELPLLFNEVNNKLSNACVEKDAIDVLSILELEQKSERENQLLDDLLYEKISPSMINIIASIWLEAPRNTHYTDHLKAFGGARLKNKGEIAFKSLLDDFVELSKKLLGSKLDFENKEKVFTQLDSVLNKYFPTHTSLAGIDHNPHTLYGSLHLHALENDDFKSDEVTRSAFSNLLKEFCELIIDCNNALPSWTKENLISQLTEHEALFKNLREELARWKEVNSNEVDEVTLIEDEYRRAIARRFDELKIFGLNFGKRTRKYQLSVAYISLTTETDFNVSEDNKVMSTNEALTSYSRLVILGEAGQGKTTLLQWLTVHCGRRSFEGEQADFNNKVPVLIQLRSILNKSSLPDSLDFYAFMTEGIETNSMHGEWIESVLENKLAIIMIDGFDEVPKERRQEVLDWIDHLCKSYDGNQFILTSRPSAYESTSLEHLDFNVIQLQTMDRKAQSDFVEHWHHAIALEYDKTKPHALRQQALSLLEKLRQQKVLRNLAQNPLLCGVLCMLHHDRNGYLPKDRTDLYESTCRLFLDSRDREKKIIETDNFNLLDLRNKESLLSDIAFWMTNNGQTTISPDILKKKLQSKSKDMPELWKKISAEELELFFIERSGLLVQVGINEIQFTHRTFQEFYTAKYIISENDTECLSVNAGNDYWNGTIQLAIGLRTSKKENEKYLTELLSKAVNFESEYDLNSATSLYLLVLSCKENMREITPRFSHQLKEVIKKVVPPPTAKVRDALASAGSIAIPYLARPNGRRSIVKDHYSALALIKIATPDAYIQLKDYFKDNRNSYIRKLCTDIKKMDCDIVKESNLVEAIIADGIEKYHLSIRVMLSFLTQNESIIEDGIPQGLLLNEERTWKLSQGLVPLAKLSENTTTELDLTNCNIDNLDILNKFSKLKSIDLSNSHIMKFPSLTNLVNLEHVNLQKAFIKHLESLSSFSSLSSLKTLNLESTNIENIAFISELALIERLNLNSTSITDLTPLENLKKLKYLDGSHLTINNLNALNNLSNLTYLSLSFSDIEDSSSLMYLTRLKELDLTCCGQENLEYLKQLTELTSLELSYNEIVDISDLVNLKKLIELDLSGNNLEDVSALSDLIELKRLWLSDNSIADVSTLANLQEVKVLNLSKNYIDDVSALISLIALEFLDLSQNNISDISSLRNLKNLTELDLSGNDIKSIEPLSTLKNVDTLSLSHTKIDSLDALEKLDKLNYLSVTGLENLNFQPLMNHSNIEFIQVGYRARHNIDKNDFKSDVYIF